jgi:hypothetical protein
MRARIFTYVLMAEVANAAPANKSETRKGRVSHIDIVPYYGENSLAVSEVIVRVNPNDRARAVALVERTGTEIIRVEDEQGFQAAKRAAGELKSLLNEIEAAKKSAKLPFAAITEAIGAQATDVGTPVLVEHRRVLELLNRYVARLEALREASERARREEQRRIEAEAQKRIAEAEAAKHKAEEEARLAHDEASRQKARADAATQQAQIAQEELARELALEASLVGAEKDRRGLVAGGRVDHTFEFKLVNLRDCINAGCINLLRWELDKRACDSSVRSQLEIDPNREPSLPGIEITRKLNVSVKAAARVA